MTAPRRVLLGLPVVLVACVEPASPGAESGGSDTGAGACVEDLECPLDSSCVDGTCVPNLPPDEPDPDGPGSDCEDARNCADGLGCIDGVCTELALLPECPGPTLATVDLPSQNGRIAAIDLVDLDQDGDDDLLAWNEDLGLALLAGDQWLISPYPAPTTKEPSIAALPVDGDAIFDLVVNGTGWLVDVGLGDGLGQFQFVGTKPGLSSLRRVTLAPDRQRVFGVNTISPPYVAALRFAGLEPQKIELDIPANEFVPAELDGEPGDEILAWNRCDAWALRHLGNDVFTEVALGVPPQTSPGLCKWLAGDLDGDGRDEAFATEPSAGLVTVLSAFANQTAPGSNPSFAAREYAAIPGGFLSGQSLDLDGDGDEELLLVSYSNGGGTLVSASDGSLLGCRASVADIPQEIVSLRIGDLDGDGEPEIVALRTNGALYVRERG